jgi:subtilase family serine protease
MICLYRPALYRAFLSASLLLLPSVVFAQSDAVQSRITQPIDETNLVTLKGNTHPLARPEFDRGPAPESQPMNRALLLLQRSPDQEAALRQLLDEQQSKSSPNFHQWLTPAQFGQRFGPSDADIATVTAWLQSHGFSVNRISAGRTVIEISGTAGQIRNAFHTEMHNYVVNGESHWANASDPQIAAALAPVVAGFSSLNDFPDEALSHQMSQVQISHNGDQPQLTGQCTNSAGAEFTCYAVTPYDFATIYNVLPLWNGTGGAAIDGTGQTIAIVAESDICTAGSPDFNVTTACNGRDDVQAYRSAFGLSGFGPPVNVILDGPDPGIGDLEAALDVEVSGAVARNAQIELVAAESTDATDGDRLSAQYIVDNNLAPVMSMSFGNCEASLGAGGNAYFNSLWEQAAAEGITVVISAGDSGSAGCDPSSSGGGASNGLAVSGIASTPFNVAMGGTDFNDAGNQTTYWKPQTQNNQTTGQSATRYIPEIPWNLSCATSGSQGCTSLPQNSPSLVVAAGGGGQSSIYPKPSWQNGPEITGLPSTDGDRDIPDVSFFSSIGSSSDAAYLICLSGSGSGASPCSLSTGAGLYLIGGTSAAAPAFAGVMAMVNQSAATQSVPAPRQGNANYILYSLAAQEQFASCNSASVAGGNNCVFYDITTGNNSVPCVGGYPNCSFPTNSNYGILVDSNGDPAWSASTGYDMATGLGSMNVANLVRNWSSVNRAASTTTLVLNGGTAVNITHGTPISVSISVSPSSPQPTGNVSLIASQGGGFEDSGNFTLSGGSASGTTVLLPGGSSYNVQANYHGDSHYAASSSPPVAVTVTPEPSKVAVSVDTFVFSFSNGEFTETPNVTSFPYGTLFSVRADVTNASSSSCVNSANSSFAYACPTGTVAFTDNGSALGPSPASLNAQGYAVTPDLGFEMTTPNPLALSGGVHTLSANYAGDNSYVAASGSSALTVTAAVTTTTVQSIINFSGPTPPSVLIGQPFGINFKVASGSWGLPPSGTFTVFDGASQIAGPESQGGTSSSNEGQVSFQGSVNATVAGPSGPHSITLQYNGDGNYASSLSTPVTVNALYTVNFTAFSANPTTVVAGAGTAVTVMATVSTTNPASNPALMPTGTITFIASPGPVLAPVTPTASADSNGNWVLQATTTFVPQQSLTVSATYSGDSNYFYRSSTQYESISVSYPDFSITPGSAPPPITAGQTGTISLTITPMTNLPTTVTFSCTGVNVAGTPCDFSPSTVVLNNGAAGMATLSLPVPPPSASLTAMASPPPRVRRVPPPPPDRPAWWGLSVVAVLAAMLLLLPGRRRSPRAAIGLASVGILCFAISCGGGGSASTGGSGGGGGGGGGGPAVTTTTLSTTSTKLAPGGTATLTITVKSPNTATGTVCFFDASYGLTNCPTLVSGTAQEQITNTGSGPAVPGTHVFTAQYFGDANNQQSQSGQLNIVDTGTTSQGFCGQNGSNGHCSQVMVTIQ